MTKLNVFVSVGGPFTDEQEKFVEAIWKRLESENLLPNTVGRNTFSADSPLKTVSSLMADCSGAVIIALERSYFSEGIEKRGGVKEMKVKDIKYATPWNQIEAAIAYARGQPLMVIVEEGVKQEGLLEKGYDWYIMSVTPNPATLLTPEFNGVLANWKKKVESFEAMKSQITKEQSNVDINSLTIGQLIKNLKFSQLWALIVALFGIIAGSIALGQHFGK